ncbi:hypothetical protein GGE09_001612 [Roseobacter sp. N2S]|nr:hypothetical protein [Roseobacter sp. N2S]
MPKQSPIKALPDGGLDDLTIQRHIHLMVVALVFSPNTMIQALQNAPRSLQLWFDVNPKII